MSGALLATRMRGDRHRPLRFVIFGGFTTLSCYALYFGLVSIGLVFWAANFGSLLFGVCLNFYLQGRYVFHDHDGRRFVRFAGGWFCIYLVQTTVIWLLIRSGLTARTAGIVVLPGTAVLSYVLQKSFVFRTGRDHA